MEPLYFEDFTVGRRFATPGATLTEAEIVHFALAYDPQPFHIDAEAARLTAYGGLIASGFQTLALSFRLFAQTGVLAACGMGSPGIDDVRWTQPVRPGDTLRVTVEVIEQRPSRSRADRGTVRLLYRVANQRDEPVLSWICNHIMARRPEPVAV